MRVRCVAGFALLLLMSGCAPRIPVRTAPIPPVTPGPALPDVTEEVSFVATAYCHNGRTASGAEARVGFVAADPGVLPIGTRIRVMGLKRGRDGLYRVMDTGLRVQGRRIDLFIASCAEARRFGRQPVRVAVIR